MCTCFERWCRKEETYGRTVLVVPRGCIARNLYNSAKNGRSASKATFFAQLPITFTSRGRSSLCNTSSSTDPTALARTRHIHRHELGAVVCPCVTLFVFCPRGAVGGVASASAIATAIRSCRSHWRSRRCLQRRTKATPSPLTRSGVDRTAGNSLRNCRFPIPVSLCARSLPKR